MYILQWNVIITSSWSCFSQTIICRTMVLSNHAFLGCWDPGRVGVCLLWLATSKARAGLRLAACGPICRELCNVSPLLAPPPPAADTWPPGYRSPLKVTEAHQSWHITTSFHAGQWVVSEVIKYLDTKWAVECRCRTIVPIPERHSCLLLRRHNAVVISHVYFHNCQT